MPTSEQISLIDSPHKPGNTVRTGNTGFNESAAAENERDIQFLNNTFKPFSSTSKQLLDSREVQKCILNLQHTYYNQAKHLSTVGLTHEVVPTPQMQICFSKAGSTAPLDSRAETSQTSRDSLQRPEPSPVIVSSDNIHFQVVLTNAVSKMVTLFDPFWQWLPKICDKHCQDIL